MSFDLPKGRGQGDADLHARQNNQQQTDHQNHHLDTNALFVVTLRKFWLTFGEMSMFTSFNI